jgi:signal transduction histidine kinase/ActR/RegA family two-component response regulator
LEAVLCTEELKRRPRRAPAYEAENRALLALAKGLSTSPERVLQDLADIALELSRGHSAGISLLEQGDAGCVAPTGDRFRWHAVAGQWAPLVWNTTTPREHSPCGTVLDRDTTLLMRHAHRYFTQFAGIRPMPVEGLLVPFHVGRRPVGTVWVVAHDDSRHFDGEDQRLLESLAVFAASAYHARVSTAAQEKTNRELKAEVVDRQRAEAALREADRHKDEFLAMLAHELRNPLNPIRNEVQILRLLHGRDEAVRSACDVMERQLGQIVLFVDDLFDVSRVRCGTIPLRKGTIELASPLHHAVEAARPLFEQRQQALTVELPPQPMFLQADPTRLAQVVGNLLTNACKFTGRGGRVWLTLERDGDHAVIRVRDSGIGIALEQLDNIFELFMQVDHSLERSTSGLGVGLTLVKSLVEMHGGTVRANSAGLGEGSEFVVRLPNLVEAPAARPKPVGSEATFATPRRILVVDVNRDSADSLAKLLQLEGNETHTAYDGLEAVQAAATLRPDVVLLDLGLPKLNGYDVARRIREQPWGDGILLVALTGWGQADDRHRTQDGGFNGHLVKPVNHAALTMMMNEAVAARAR